MMPKERQRTFMSTCWFSASGVCAADTTRVAWTAWTAWTAWLLCRASYWSTVTDRDKSWRRIVVVYSMGLGWSFSGILLSLRLYLPLSRLAVPQLVNGCIGGARVDNGLDSVNNMVMYIVY
ncbi:hypothetical protein P152DRAFT_457346 [Eremomyces bilateralis CBS 781.70]|uniref:Uncharacterized protein n=1 Tax=Eremomyces bilateralis CBS 781.70 TaxID=1392243 RepID=A0A6G1G7E5_9PEZI|nr:uncharacterized protein P152DRAFT_457346 [Eremomyces bilateralis CBS 781.70]KAF1813978.1 hypothetical protein P152DRAFT_457346 [Eremomyces bilateralis CBS 781.70]